jgi:hypothetical protein
VLGAGEPLHDRARLGAIVEHRPSVAAGQRRLPIGGIDAGQAEEIVVDARLKILVLREKAGDEVALLVHGGRLR